MTVDDLLKTVREAGGFIEAAGDRLRVHLKPAAITDELRVDLARMKPELIAQARAAAQVAHRTITDACKRADIQPATVLQAIDGADLAAFADQIGYHAQPPLFASAYIAAIRDRLDREAGRVPPYYTTAAHCDGCGPVWLWPGAVRVIACPWCWNRFAGRFIPRPTQAERIEAPNR